MSIVGATYSRPPKCSDGAAKVHALTDALTSPPTRNKGPSLAHREHFITVHFLVTFRLSFRLSSHR
jgi:hypothetical protein